MCGEGLFYMWQSKGRYSMTGNEKLRRGGDILNFSLVKYLSLF